MLAHLKMHSNSNNFARDNYAVLLGVTQFELQFLLLLDTIYTSYFHKLIQIHTFTFQRQLCSLAQFKLKSILSKKFISIFLICRYSPHPFYAIILHTFKHSFKFTLSLETTMRSAWCHSIETPTYTSTPYFKEDAYFDYEKTESFM